MLGTHDGTTVTETISYDPCRDSDVICDHGGIKKDRCQVLRRALRSERGANDAALPSLCTMARWAAQRPKDPAERDLTERNQAIIDSFASGRFTMRAIGERFGIHYSRVSRIVSAAERARGKT